MFADKGKMSSTIFYKEISHQLFNFLGLSELSFLWSRKIRKCACLGKPHFKKCRVYLGIAQIAIAPPPFTQTGTLGHFISEPTDQTAWDLLAVCTIEISSEQ